MHRTQINIFINQQSSCGTIFSYLTSIIKFQNMKTKFLYLSFIVAAFVIFQSCNSTANLSSSSATKALQQNWKHSHEESSTDGSEIYRPSNYKTFPPSMFRQAYNLQANGKCEYLVLHPADAHYMAKGNWSYDPETHTLEIKDAYFKTVAKYEVVELGKDILKVRKL